MATLRHSSQLGSRATKMEGAARFHPAPPPLRRHTKGQPLLPQTAPAPWAPLHPLGTPLRDFLPPGWHLRSCGSPGPGSRTRGQPGPPAAPHPPPSTCCPAPRAPSYGRWGAGALGPLRSPPPTGNIPEAFLKLGGPPPHTPAPTPPPAGRMLGPRVPFHRPRAPRGEG